MATPNIVPRADNEGSLGTESKRWNNIQTVKLNDVEMPIDPPTIEDAGKLLCLNFDGSGYEYRTLNLPLITENDANKILAVKSDSSDTEWVVADYVPTSLTTTTPTASSIPIADSGGKIDDGWIPATVARTESLKAIEQSAGDEITLRSLIAGAGNDPMTITIYDEIPITDNLVIPENIELNFKRGGKLSVAATKTLTINGHLSVGFADFQIFSVSSTNQVLNLAYATPQMFGTGPDAVQYAFDSVRTGGIVEILPRTTVFSSAIARVANMMVKGSGWASILSTNVSPTVTTLPIIWVQASGVILKDFKVTWETMPARLIANKSVEKNDTVAIGWRDLVGEATLLENVVVNNVYVYGAKQHGISIGYSNNARIVNNRVEEVYATGIFPIFTNNIKINGNLVYRTSDAGIDLQADTGKYADNAVISNNIVQCTNIGIGSHGGRGVTISDNVIDNTWHSAIYCQASPIYNVSAPFVTSVTGNIIRRPFQFYGEGNFHLNPLAETIGGNHSIIEVRSDSEVVIANNNIKDDAGLYNYEFIIVQGTNVSITGNNANIEAPIGIRAGYSVVSDYSNIDSLTITGNNIKMADGHGITMIVLNGVATGVISGNYFSCGGTNGRFIYSNYAKNIIVDGNRIENYNQLFHKGFSVSEVVFPINSKTVPYAGTWTATFTCGTSGTITLSSSTGHYMRIGNMVFATGTFVVGSVNSPVGGLIISGLPFSNVYEAPVSVFASSIIGDETNPMIVGTLSGSTIKIIKVKNGNNVSFAGDIKSGSKIGILVMYEAPQD